MVSLLALLGLVFSFLGGLKEGAVRTFFSLAAGIVALPLAGLACPLLTGVLSFLPGENWENFLGFFISFAIMAGLLSLIFLLPRRALQQAWHYFLYRLLSEKDAFFNADAWDGGIVNSLPGGLLATFGTAIFMAVFVLVLQAYPIFDWLEEAVSSSGVLIWLVDSLGFVRGLLPEAIRGTAAA